VARHSIQWVLTPGKSKIPTIPEKPWAKEEKTAKGKRDVGGGLS
jgi:hypothetical protein